ncbi:hypothetical protein EIP86_004050 [Pleurotus ostreatoroseus]|nr:hypothetical protein EIP86_004050 [Pleurotus ostreatoroseus]
MYSPTVLSVLELVASFTPGGFFFGSKSINFGTPYYALSISLNVVVTTLICYRLLRMSSQIKQLLGKDNAEPYTNVAAVLIESAAPYTLAGIMVLIPYARGNLVSVALGQVWTKLTVRPSSYASMPSDPSVVQCISPQWIILRVASGRAWSKETVERVTGRAESRTNHSTMGRVTFADVGSCGDDSFVLRQTTGSAAEKNTNSATTLAEAV